MSCEPGFRVLHGRLPYYRKLTLVVIKVLEINATLINANCRKNYFPIKEKNAKEALKFQNKGN